jgi:hypothetical protein
MAAMELNDRMSRFSLAYIAAVAAHAGYQVTEPPIDKDSIDGILISQEGRRPMIGFQAKATGQDILKEDHVAFSLPIKNYDDLRKDTLTPRILIVLVVPEVHPQWISHCEDDLRLRRCGYYISLSGRPDSSNVATVTVHIPRTAMFTPDALQTLMGRAEAGIEL